MKKLMFLFVFLFTVGMAVNIETSDPPDRVEIHQPDMDVQDLAVLDVDPVNLMYHYTAAVDDFSPVDARTLSYNHLYDMHTPDQNSDDIKLLKPGLMSFVSNMPLKPDQIQHLIDKPIDPGWCSLRKS